MINSVVVDGQLIFPSKVVCVGRNYVEHIHELGNEIPDDMVLFNKPNSAISGELLSYHEEPLHYEGEICFVYGKGAFTAVGFGIDLTKRELQSRLKAKGLPWERAKAFNGSAVFSEFVSIKNHESPLRLVLAVNNEVKQEGSTDLMLYQPAQILHEILLFMSLEDGDVVMTGTPKGVGTIEAGSQYKGYIYQNEALLTQHTWVAK